MTQFTQTDTIPEFESMTIGAGTEHSTQQNCFPSEVECDDLRYLHSRTAFLIRVFPLLEYISVNSSWSSMRALSYQIIANAVRLPDVPKMRGHFKTQLK
jgi:hypothetical protein